MKSYSSNEIWYYEFTYLSTYAFINEFRIPIYLYMNSYT